MNKNHKILLATCATLSLLAPAGAFAQDASGGIADIIVTAQKRAQNLQDVPIAITAITAETIQANRITSVQDLTGLAPNVIVRPSAGGSSIPTFSMRGLTSYGVVPGSDKQVSINLDGVYISATRGALFEMPDIARIEVLRGPQGTLFGRNATAGAVSIVSKDPDGQFGGRLEAGLGNYNQKRVRLSVDLPQVGPFSGYVSFVHNERRGDIKNLGAGARWDRTGSGAYLGKTYNTGQGVDYSPDYLGSKNVETYFGALKFAPSDTFRIVYKYDLSMDHSTPEGVGVNAVNFNLATGTAGGVILGALYNNQPVGGGPYGPAVLALNGKRPKAVNNYFTVPGYLKNQGHSVTISSELTDNLSVKSITAYRKTNLQQAVSQIGGLGGLVVTQAAKDAVAAALGAPTAASLGVVGNRLVDTGTQIQNLSKQWSQEVQFNYDSRLVTLTVGGIYFRSEDRSGPAQLTRATLALAFLPATGEIPLGTSTGVSYNKAISYAGYAQAEIHASSQLDIVLGGRITRDLKSGNFLSGTARAAGGGLPATPNGVYTPPAGCPVTSNPVGACRIGGVYSGLSSTPFTYSDTRPIYSVGLNYKPNNDVLVFGKFSTGYVSGGAIGGVPFDPETVKSFEAGLKAELFDRRLRTNLALFHASYKNVQSSQSGRNVGRPDLGTLIVTGFDEKTYGFEFESTANPIDGLTLTASLGYTHIKQSNFSATYLSSLLVAGQSPATLNVQPTGTPKWTSNLSAQYETQPLFAEASLMARVDANWRSKLVLDGNADRATLIPAYVNTTASPSSWVLNGRVALRNVKIGVVSTELAVWSRNLLNNKLIQYSLTIPYTVASSYQQARTVGVELIAKF